MAITDYIPNIFGSAAPSSYESLLGMGLLTPEQVQKQQNVANIQGLLGAGLSLAQGMGRTGPRRSAAENIFGALAGGFGAAGGAYQQGLQNVVQQQQLQSAALTQKQALDRQAAIAAAGREDPALAQLLMIDPAEGVKQLALKRQLGVLGGQTGVKTPESLRAQAQQIYASGNAALKPLGDSLIEQADRLEVQGAPQVVVPQVQPQPQAQPQVTAAQETPISVDQQTGEKILPTVLVTEKPVTSRIAALNAKADAIRQEMDRLSDPKLAANKSVQNAFERNKTKLEEIRKQISEAAVVETDLKQFRATAPQQFQQQIDNLEQLSMTGQLTPDQLSQRMGDISKQINDYNQKETEFKRAQTNYQNEAYRVAQDVAPGVDPSKYTSAQIAEIQKRIDKKEKELRIAGRTLLNLNVGNKKFAEEFGKGVAEGVAGTQSQAISAQKTLSTINTIRPLIQAGVYAGPLSASQLYIDRLASSFGFTSGSINEKLARTSQAMQGLASLELDAAAQMKGQGAITENERALIARAAAGNLAQFTSGEVSTLLNALEKTANSKISAHSKNLQRLRKNKDTAELADFYELPDSGNLQDAARQELDRRRGK